MTRETKVGLVIAGSFLCLVCVVVASKMRRGDGPTLEPEEQTASHVNDGKKESDSPRNTDKAHVSSAQRTSADKGGASPGQKRTESSNPGNLPPQDMPPPLAMPPSTNTNDPIAMQLARLKMEENAPNFTPMQLPAGPKADAAPLPKGTDPGPLAGSPLPAAPTVESVKIPAPGPIPSVDDKNKGSVTIAAPMGVIPPFDPNKKDNIGPNPFNSGSSGVVEPTAPAPLKKDHGHSKPMAPGNKGESPAINIKTESVIPPPSSGSSGIPAPVAEVKPTPITPDGPPAFPTLPANPTNAANGPMKETGPPVAIVPPPKNGANDTPQPGFPMATKLNVSSPIGNPPITKPSGTATDNPVPAPPISPPNGSSGQGVPTITTVPVNRGNDTTNAPPPFVPNQGQGSGNTIPTIPPISTGGIKPLPPVKIYEPDLHICQPADSSFAKVSERFYGTDKYSEALLAYNRDNQAVLKNGFNLATNPPNLQPGQQLLKPPIGLLERDYRARIRDAEPNLPVADAGPMPTPAVRLSQPTTLPSIGSASGANIPTLTSARDAQSASQPYVVQNPSGEGIREVAQRRLGDPNRWTEIYRLNPSVQPQFPIPAGTRLSMPGN